MANQDLNRILKVLREHRRFLKNKYGIKEIGVFGSYARGEQTCRSDLDILVNFLDNSIDLFDFLDLKEYLSDLMGVRVDLVMKDGLKPHIGRNILNQVTYA